MSAAHAIACRLLGVRHLRTRPQTKGKAEPFIRTMLESWAYGAIYGYSAERTAGLDGWLFSYNHHRNHRALGRQPPAARLLDLHSNLHLAAPSLLGDAARFATARTQ